MLRFLLLCALWLSADACSCMPTWTVNNRMHLSTSVVRVWVSYEMATKPPVANDKDPDQVVLDSLPKYYVVEATTWFKQQGNLQKGKFIVKTQTGGHMCGMSLPVKQEAILFGGSIVDEMVPGYAAPQPVLSINSCLPPITNFPIPRADWATLFNYDPDVCVSDDCGDMDGWWVHHDVTPIKCKDQTTTVMPMCEIGSSQYSRGCEWKPADPNDCP